MEIFYFSSNCVIIIVKIFYHIFSKEILNEQFGFLYFYPDK